MGSFASTCAVSGLPIEAGDDVRYLLLTKNPYDSNIMCSITDLWFPRSFPLRAKYNDYGSVEDVQHPGLQQLVLDALKLDVIERTWGENTCHNVPVSKDQSFDQLLKALWEGRVLVHEEVKPSWSTKHIFSKPLPKGVPTVKGVLNILLKAGFVAFNGEHTKYSVIVDDTQGYGRIRVRSGDFDPDTLRSANRQVKTYGYNTMLCPGEGDSTELLIRPQAKTPDYYFFNSDKKPPLPVSQAMIREDVWQALVKLPMLSDAVEQAKKRWKYLINLEPEQFFAKDYSPFSQDALPFTVGLATVFSMVAKKHDELTKEEIEYFLQSAGELINLQYILGTIRYQWRPTYGNGPQFGEWGEHVKVLKALTKVAEKKKAEQDKLYERYK